MLEQPANPTPAEFIEKLDQFTKQGKLTPAQADHILASATRARHAPGHSNDLQAMLEALTAIKPELAKALLPAPAEDEHHSMPDVQFAASFLTTPRAPELGDFEPSIHPATSRIDIRASTPFDPERTDIQQGFAATLQPPEQAVLGALRDHFKTTTDNFLRNIASVTYEPSRIAGQGAFNVTIPGGMSKRGPVVSRDPFAAKLGIDKQAIKQVDGGQGNLLIVLPEEATRRAFNIGGQGVSR